MNAKPLLIAALATTLATIAVPSLAEHALDPTAVNIVNLKDGSTLYVFRDGKMAKTDKYNRPVHLKSGEVLEARDGRQVTAIGNEVARLTWLLNRDHRN
jgi:hypothetical protein